VLLLVAAGAATGLYVYGGLGGDGQRQAQGRTPAEGQNPPGAGTGVGTDPDAGAAPTTDPGDDSSGPGSGGDDDNSGPGNGDDGGDAPTVPRAFEGTWNGTAQQPGGTIRSWTTSIVLERDEGEGTFRIAGEGLDCAGVATVVAESSRRLVLDAPVTEDANGNCADRGTVTLQRQGRSVAVFGWEDAADPANRATGRLRLVD
jgi:hypothetical protein